MNFTVDDGLNFLNTTAHQGMNILSNDVNDMSRNNTGIDVLNNTMRDFVNQSNNINNMNSTFNATNAPLNSTLNAAITPITVVNNTVDYHLGEPGDHVLAILFMLFGCLFLFYGRKIFKLTCFIIGYFASLVVVYSVASKYKDQLSKEAFYSITFLVPIAGGALVLFLWKMGVLFVGAFTGYNLGIFILSWKENYFIEDHTYRLAFMVVLIAVFTIAAMFLEKWIIILGTSLSGANMAIIGLDFFVRTGYYQAFTMVFEELKERKFQISNLNALYGLLASLLVLTIVGVIIQVKFTGKNVETKEQEKK